MSSKLPPLTQEPLLHVDAAPDGNYPIRILEAHLANTDCHWETNGLPESEQRVYDAMNEHCVQRAEILRKAIARLQEAANAEL